MNLGILAHVDAGKTSLTERLLQLGGVIAEVGNVDDGNTQTDSLALERQRGITIKTAVMSFVLDDLAVNLIDTPGHPDFIAEVERSLSVLDGAVLVISAVEGVQAQTRVLLRALHRLRIPTLIFVNKIDRTGARYTSLLRDISARLTPDIAPMCTVHALGTPSAHPEPSSPALADLLAKHDDAVLTAFVDGSLSEADLRRSLAMHTAHVHPVYFGSAITGAGVSQLIAGIKEFLPAPPDSGPMSGTVFKVERGPAGEKIAYVRMFSGTVNTRDRLQFRDKEGKVTAITVFGRGPAIRSSSVSAGQIGKLWGLNEIRIGDTIGEPHPRAAKHQFPPPTLETVVVPHRSSDKVALHAALSQLAEQDPLIGLRQNGEQISVSLYGEVQKEVIEATLQDFGLAVSFQETTTICVERVAGTGAAVEIINEGENPYLATVGLQIEPGPIGSGCQFKLGVELGSMPSAFFNAVSESVPRALQRGPHGWQVIDCVVTMTHSGYWARQSHAHGTFDKSMSSTAGDFRNLTPLVLMNALKQAGTVVCEPIHLFHLEIPADTLSTVQTALGRVRAVAMTTTMQGEICVLEGEIPAAQVHALERMLPSLTRGEGVLADEFKQWA